MVRTALAALAWLLLGCASQPPPPDPNADPMTLLPEKRRVLYFKRGCDDPNEQVAEVVRADERATVLWKAECADGRVLRCSYRRVLKCRWDRSRETGAATSTSKSSVEWD